MRSRKHNDRREAGRRLKTSANYKRRADSCMRLLGGTHASEGDQEKLLSRPFGYSIR
jgi:hypothetical protein